MESGESLYDDDCAASGGGGLRREEDRAGADLVRDMDAVYDAWREAEGRAAQVRECERLCAARPGDRPADRAEREYQRLRARFSPAYFAGSSAFRRRRDRVCLEGRRSLAAAAAAGLLVWSDTT